MAGAIRTNGAHFKTGVAVVCEHHLSGQKEKASRGGWPFLL
jgi:hypothetical protein